VRPLDYDTAVHLVITVAAARVVGLEVELEALRDGHGRTRKRTRGGASSVVRALAGPLMTKYRRRWRCFGLRDLPSRLS